MLAIRKIPILAAFALALTFIITPSAAREQTEERLATVKGLIGNAEVRLAPGVQKVRRERAAAMSGMPMLRISGSITNEWTPLRINMVVGETCEIRTSAQSEVRLETAEGSIIRIGENSHIEVTVMRADTRRVRQGGKAQDVTTINTRVKVNDGSVISNIKRIMGNEENDIRFETPTATAAIRGTTLEIDARRGGSTTFRAFDGTVYVTPAGSRHALELRHGEMVEIAPKQRAAIVRPVPEDYQRRSPYLPGEQMQESSAPAEESKTPVADTVNIAQKSPVDADPSVKLTIDLGQTRDTLMCYADDTVSVQGIVTPVGAKITINGAEAVIEDNGLFQMRLVAPPDSGLFKITIVAENDTLTETVIRPLKVAHVYRTVELIAPAEGQELELPYIVLNGTAPPGSRVYLLGHTVNARRDGTFNGEIPLPPGTTGDIKVRVEIVNKDNEAVIIERNVTYQK